MDARNIVERAWAALPAGDRRLLESIRADQWEVCRQPLGAYTDAMLRSADRGRLSAQEIARANAALGLWVPQLRVVLINEAHPAFDGLDDTSFTYDLSKIAWHEWGHALSIDRAAHSDLAAGEHFLQCLPLAIQNLVRAAGYRRSEYTHEVVAEIYSMLMIRRRLGQTGQPPWLHQEVYELVRRVAGWNQ